MCVLLPGSQNFVDGGLGITPNWLWLGKCHCSSKKGNQYNCVFYLIPKMCSVSVLMKMNIRLFLKSILIIFVEILNIFIISVVLFIYTCYTIYLFIYTFIILFYVKPIDNSTVQGFK